MPNDGTNNPTTPLTMTPHQQQAPCHCRLYHTTSLSRLQVLPQGETSENKKSPSKVTTAPSRRRRCRTTHRGSDQALFSPGSSSSSTRIHFPSFVTVLLLFFLSLASQTTVKAQSAASLPDCVDNVTGYLKPGWAIEETNCIDVAKSVFFLNVISSSTSPTGLNAGAPTDITLVFGNMNRTTSAGSFDPQAPGFFLPTDNGMIILDFSPHFVYNKASKSTAINNVQLDLSIAPHANYIYGQPCPVGQDFVLARNVCGGWFTYFSNRGRNFNSITMSTKYRNGLSGARGTQLGIKFAHLHPDFSTGIGIYTNAVGTCSQDSTIYCVSDDDCQGTAPCVAQPLTGTITVTVINGNNNTIIYMGQQNVTFDQQPRSTTEYTIRATNFGLMDDRELIESVSGQRVYQNVTVVSTTKEADQSFQQAGPYAPRFLLFSPTGDATKSYPFPRSTSTIGFNINTDSVTGTIEVDGNQIATMELIPPTEWAGGELIPLPDGLPQPLFDSPNTIGGSVFAIPVQVGNWAGVYTVRVTMNSGGSVAESYLIAEGSIPETSGPSTNVPTTTTPSTIAPTTAAAASTLATTTLAPTAFSSLADSSHQTTANPSLQSSPTSTMLPSSNDTMVPSLTGPPVGTKQPTSYTMTPSTTAPTTEGQVAPNIFDSGTTSPTPPPTMRRTTPAPTSRPLRPIDNTMADNETQYTAYVGRGVLIAAAVAVGLAILLLSVCFIEVARRIIFEGDDDDWDDENDADINNAGRNPNADNAAATNDGVVNKDANRQMDNNKANVQNHPNDDQYQNDTYGEEEEEEEEFHNEEFHQYDDDNFQNNQYYNQHPYDPNDHYNQYDQNDNYNQYDHVDDERQGLNPRSADSHGRMV